MSDADLVALKKAAPLIKEMLVAVDKELYARTEVRAVEGVRLVEGRNNRSWNIEDEAILKNTIVVYTVWNFINCFYDLFLKITETPWKHNTGIHFG
jgi:hypothetical protein